MDLKSLGIGIIMILCAIAPFYIVQRNSKKRKKKLEDLIRDIARKHHTELGETEFWNLSVMALSKDKQYLFSVRTESSEPIMYAINLHEYARCRVEVKSHQANYKDSTVEITDEIKLCFYAASQTEAKELSLYKAGSDSSFVNGELQLAERWRKKTGLLK